MFAPFAGVKPHARLERHVANRLSRAGARTLLVTCSGLLRQRCVVMESMNLDPHDEAGKQHACIKCTATAAALAPSIHPDVVSVDLHDLMPPAATMLVDQIIEEFTREPTPSFVWNGVPFGAFWCLETVLKYKTDEQSEEFRQHFKEVAQSGSLAFAAAHTLLREGPPQAVLTHSIEYGINRSFIQPFAQAEVPAFSFRGAGNLSRTDFGLDVRVVRTPEIIASIRRSRSLEEPPLALDELSPVITWADDHLNQRAAHVYSPARSSETATAIRRVLAINDLPTVVAFSSSPDERLAASLAQLAPRESPILHDPDEHYRFARLVFETARANPDINFVYRLHPRLARNDATRCDRRTLIDSSRSSTRKIDRSTSS